MFNVYIAYAFPADNVLNVICVIMQFGSIDPVEIPKKLRWFIICMQCECKCKSKDEENLVMEIELPHQTTQIQSDPAATTSNIRTEHIVIKGCKTEQSTNIITECNNESGIDCV